MAERARAPVSAAPRQGGARVHSTTLAVSFLRVPFRERGGKLRGALDLLTGCYPRFVFGGSVGAILPVFHLHRVTPETLDAQLRYLAENGYRTVTSDAIAHFVRRGVHPGPRTVALCFDDAWASVWTVAGPLLRRYGFRAITYAIPGLIADADTVRPGLEDGVPDPAAVDRSHVPFATWPELRALHDSGLVDVQCHTYSHALVFTAPVLVGFVAPEFAARPLLLRPVVSENGRERRLTPADLGAPLYVQRSRMSDGRRYFDDEEVRARCVRYVAEAGGPRFFERPDWRRRLRQVAAEGCGHYESPQDQWRAITEELARCRDTLAERLKSPTVRHACLPWAVSGEIAQRALRALGFETAFADRLFGVRAVRAGDDPFRLMRLHERYIFSLPGRGRRVFLFTRRAAEWS